MTELKKCSKCGNEKDRNGFWGDPRTKDQLRAECKSCIRKRNRRWQRRNPEKCAGFQRKFRYGLTARDYADLVRNQNGRCLICRRNESETGPLVVDHCHTAYFVRGLLCNRCNVLVGYIEKNRALLRGVLDYVDFDFSEVTPELWEEAENSEPEPSN